MRIEVGTLQEIGAQVGDVVEWSGGTGLRRWTIGLIRGGNYYEGDDHDAPLSRLPHWRIISRANQGPVLEVTTVRREVVPGVYGKVCVSTHADRGTVSIGIGGVMGASYVSDHGAKCFSFTADELTAAIATLTAIRDAMADSSAT